MENTAPLPAIAPLANVFICARTLESALKRRAHLPGMVCFYGPAGYGKSCSLAYAARKYGAYTVEVKSHWSRKGFLSKILQAMDLNAAGSLENMLEQVCTRLRHSGRALVIDEADHLANRGLNYIELVRDIFDSSNAAIMLAGESGLPGKLKRWPRFYSRILAWAEALPLSYEDAQLLRRLYCRETAISDDLLALLHQNVKSARLLAVNLELLQETARNLGLTEIDLKTWGERRFYLGDAPICRRL